MLTDAKDRPIELRDYDAKEGVGVQIGSLGHKLWVCVDGICVLRVNAPTIDITDQRLNVKQHSMEELTGKTREEIIEILGEPDDIATTSRKYRNPLIYKYDKWELTFGPDKDDVCFYIMNSETHDIAARYDEDA